PHIVRGASSCGGGGSSMAESSRTETRRRARAGCSAILSLCLATTALAVEPSARSRADDDDAMVEMPSHVGRLRPGEVREFLFLVPDATLLYAMTHTCPGVRVCFRSPDGVTRSAADAGRLPGFRHESGDIEGVGMEEYEI